MRHHLVDITLLHGKWLILHDVLQSVAFRCLWRRLWGDSCLSLSGNMFLKNISEVILLALKAAGN